MATEHTLLTDGDGNTILPFTDAEIVATRSGRSNLAKELQTIDSHIKGVKEGVVIVDHAVRADRWNKAIRMDFVGDATGSVEFDGSGSVEVSLATSTDHRHEIEQIEGLEVALSKKAPLVHAHEEYQDYNQIHIQSEAYTGTLEAGPNQRGFRLIAGNNIGFDVDESSHTITIKANLETASVRRAATADTLKNIKIDTDADRPNNERYVVTATYGGYSQVGTGVDFHLTGSRKAFDGRLGIDSRAKLTYQSGDTVHAIFHEGNMGPNSGLNADLLDGRQASDFSLSTHQHQEYALNIHDHEEYALIEHEHTEVGNSQTPLQLYSQTQEIRLTDGNNKNYTLYHTGYKPTAQDVGALSSDAGCALLGVVDGYLAKENNVEAIAIKQADNATTWNGQSLWVGEESERPGVGLQFCLAPIEEV